MKKKKLQKKSEKIEIRVTQLEKNQALARASALGYENLSAFVKVQMLRAPAEMITKPFENKKS